MIKRKHSEHSSRNPERDKSTKRAKKIDDSKTAVNLKIESSKKMTLITDETNNSPEMGQRLKKQSSCAGLREDSSVTSTRSRSPVNSTPKFKSSHSSDRRYRSCSASNRSGCSSINQLDLSSSEEELNVSAISQEDVSFDQSLLNLQKTRCAEISVSKSTSFYELSSGSEESDCGDVRRHKSQPSTPVFERKSGQDVKRLSGTPRASFMAINSLLSQPNKSGNSDCYKDFRTPNSSLTDCCRSSSPLQIFTSASPVLDTMCHQNMQYQYRRKSYGLPNYDVREFKDVDKLRFIDTHCHLDFLFKRLDFKGSYKSYQAVNRDTFPLSYEGCVAIFCDPQTFGKPEIWAPLLDEPNVWAAFGCHPHMAKNYNSVVESYMDKALEHKKTVALGEIGLDYSHRNNCDRNIQKKVFEKQLNIAVKKQLPLVIHSRDSTEDTMEIMKRIVPSEYKIHRHCFTGDWAEASDWLATFPNLYIGLTAVVTYPTATSVHDVARRIPLNRLLLETDTPYFLPRNSNKEKKWSHPGMAIHVASQIAALRSELLEDIIRATRENTKQMYNI